MDLDAPFIEFTYFGRRIRLDLENDKFYLRKIMNGVETKNESWIVLKTCLISSGGKRNKEYSRTPPPYVIAFVQSLDGQHKKAAIHRIMYYAHHPEWDIYDPKKCIDHIDGNRQNNKIENLRPVTFQQNSFNRTAKGCNFDKRSGKWKAYIHLDGRHHHIGFFETEVEAHNAYMLKKEQLHRII
jgi:hypothetical protein